ncbi:unnamed protein product [Mytilus edulis]|uniref:Uncharacterized protein n=1 Tax=Mytilus edulis TaxID=6550 RepID=A0A8S3QLF7_MYTED|nr:unnamed protein product [Mytilus edulis]
MGSYEYCSPDGMKDLWCNDHSSCYTNKYSKYGFEFINQCLACEAVPEWEVPLPNVTFLSLDVEIINEIGTERLQFGELMKFARCGVLEYRGSKYDCDCSVAEFFKLKYNEFNRIFGIKFSKSTCQNPKSLRGINTETLFYNTSLHHLMIYDVQDGCPKVGQCKCVCTSQPITDSLIIDCSNQSCKDLPDVVPDTRHKIVLIIEGNQIRNVDSKYYFKDVKSLNLSRNPIQTFDESIQNLTNAVEIIITDHMLDSLPRQVQLLDPNVFRLGQNGIPCNCDNRWIGEWRKFKKSKVYSILFKL